MQITIEISEEILESSAMAAVRDSYAVGGSYGRYENGKGYNAIVRQVTEWVASQDYKPLVEELAPGVIREVVRGILIESLKTAAKKAVKQMEASGELGLLAQKIISGEV